MGDGLPELETPCRDAARQDTIQDADTKFVIPWYTDFVLKNVTITLSEEVALWARVTAARQNTSVSRLVGQILDAQMRQSGDYLEAWRQWQALTPLDIDASRPLSRDEAHER